MPHSILEQQRPHFLFTTYSKKCAQKIALDLFIRYTKFVFNLEFLKKYVFYLFSLKYSYDNSTIFFGSPTNATEYCNTPILWHHRRYFSVQVAVCLSPVWTLETVDRLSQNLASTWSLDAFPTISVHFPTISGTSMIEC